ncbi:MAG: xanthine dehydrogenase family protein molybdopterin-binding subunit, partial [Anaerolineales bacterium]|nr:xanthine dehydrogenase family protein molybdopterin-binding subunit [Anaerolineales bacterium]
MTYKVIGKRVKRVEDPRLLTGGALFVGDVNLPNMLHAAFFRSDYAHAKIKSIDTSLAKEIPGVVGVYTAEDMGEAWEPGPPLVSPPPTLEGVVFNSRRQVPLVKDKVKHAGEIIAVVVAESRYIAEDAVEEIYVDYEPLPAVTNLEKCLEPGHPLVHDDLDSNLAAYLVQNKGDYEAAKKEADLVLKRKFKLDRGAAVAMENRGIVVDW